MSAFNEIDEETADLLTELYVAAKPIDHLTLREPVQYLSIVHTEIHLLKTKVNSIFTSNTFEQMSAKIQDASTHVHKIHLMISSTNSDELHHQFSSILIKVDQVLKAIQKKLKV